ncbi:DNA/RNA nuclease SfsA [Cyanobacterium aponinum UTEX 3222]|uniref:Sugar fermentation stimulation protein homolog n=2 Tax=Cyanobacterium aponinum TaxID=379064 RepID=K9Z5X8_CYAAP|nr:DNA/RNA nuclease SfsA [Cyanobacterium aponinum]WRL43503.1 DNA/RNA nuclease SfsA [Cyanobacterium aponinum UTEX 3222]AFZ54549.1 Sugar fermentation stimulation protein A [Cyanobacterium aponinum PCC 10605]MBD2394674.1 DNA/RNA nuclease SfsA [Cyanobacterium aponinum FACHB-4101]PHV63810.1 DNA/RNA nuclease SfsA [Cyanobacterium aponinum IPPAS B-1201]WPF88051.1 DNA/RNA nuclease SfsA [Cyanobacterium aponinum AL20115]
MSFLYKYPPLISGTLVRRYKRFLSDIELDNGELITAHCANTGPMIGLCKVGSRVMVSKSDNPKRKLAYTWEMIDVGEENHPIWVGINTGLPNRIVKLALEKHIINELAHQYTQIKNEVKFGHDGKSRIDFVLKAEESQPPIYLEVKNTTLAENNIAMFPDTETIRGQKHLKELIELSADAKPVMLYFINRSDCKHFTVGREFDQIYGRLFDEALDKGVKILPCRFDISPQGINYLGIAQIL